MFEGTVSKYQFRSPSSEPIRRARREACDRVRMENAAKRNKTLPRAVRRAMMAAMAEAKAKEVPTDAEISVADELNRLDERTPVEGGGVTDNAGTETEQVEVSPLPIRSKSTSKSKHHHEADLKKKRQAKSYTGSWDLIDEGIGLASDDGDVARIHAANRKAWPRGQNPIAAHATAEDREIAELVCRGLISHEDLQVEHDNFEGDVCLYTVRVVEAPKKGRKGKNLRRQAVQITEPVQREAESDWWYLDDEAYARLLNDGVTDLADWSDTSSFVYVN